MDGRRVYSYLRFSDPKQAEGHSAERQIAYAERWAAERGLALDSSLSMRDEGLSAYHQAHVRIGALGVFLRALEDGRVPAGSVLIVEGLDRLSRAEPIQAQAQLAQIINSGVTVVTASDGKEYSRELLKANPMDLVYSLLVMIRAHEESDTKSARVKAAIRRQCEGWIAGTWRGVIRNGKDPRWVRWTGERFELVPEYADAIREVLKLYSDGYSGQAIERHLIDRHGRAVISVTGPHLYKLVRREDLYGVRLLNVDGQPYRLEGYYPPLISREQWEALQGTVGTRVKRVGKGEVPGILTGMRLCFCGYCGKAVVGQATYRDRDRRADGKIKRSARRLWCCDNMRKLCMGKSVSAEKVESAILHYCSDQLRLDSLIAGDDATQALRARSASIKAEIGEAERQIERITDALLSSDDPAPLAFARRARELEDRAETLRRALREVEGQMARANNARHIPALASTWAALRAAALDLDYDARMRVRKLIAETFARIVIWTDGNPPGNGCIDLQLISKTGAARIISIDQASGEWREGMSYTLPG